eukprot:360877-Chlamydomonas_euryale.AAC.2
MGSGRAGVAHGGNPRAQAGCGTRAAQARMQGRVAARLPRQYEATGDASPVSLRFGRPARHQILVLGSILFPPHARTPSRFPAARVALHRTFPRCSRPLRNARCSSSDHGTPADVSRGAKCQPCGAARRGVVALVARGRE